MGVIVRDLGVSVQDVMRWLLTTRKSKQGGLVWADHSCFHWIGAPEELRGVIHGRDKRKSLEAEDHAGQQGSEYPA